MDLESKPFDEVLMRGGADARKELARQLSAVLSEDGSSITQREEAVSYLIKLATDPVLEVRQGVAEALDSVTPLEPDLIFTIIADEEDIALPFIANSPALDLGVMLAVLKAGDVLRQMQIAARHDLLADCAEHIVNNTEWPVCASLLDNPRFEPSERDYRTLHQRFFGEVQIVDRLLARGDLPLDIRILQAKRTSGRIQAYLDAAAFTKNDPTEMVVSAEEAATLQVLAQAPEDELGKAIAFLLAKNLLTPSLLLRAALAGEMRVVENALSVLSGVPPRRLQKLLYRRGFTSCKAIFNRCRLAPPCVWLIQAAAEVERACSERGEGLSPDAFGVRIIETIITQLNRLALNEKMRLLDLVESLGPERARVMAGKLKTNLARAA